MLRSITLRNFRAFKEQKFSFSKLNVFVGKNNSGKSSALSAINLIAQTMKEQDLDGTPLILNGTYDTEPLALKDWIADMMAAEHIQLYPYRCDSMFKELSQLGIPKKDHKWVRLARSVPSQHIVTEDIDLFDPAKKNASSVTREDIKANRKGPVAKALRKTYNINVICSCHVPEICAAL